MAMRTPRLVLALSFLYFSFCNADDKKPYHIKKSAFCYSDQDREVCSGDKYNFYSAVKQIVDNVDKLSKKQKDIAKVSGDCANALKKALCSKPSPLCLEGNDDSGAKRVCGQLRRECPASTRDSLDKFEEECVKYMQRQFTNLTCVDADTKFKGYCPKPTGKMPVSYWQAHAEMSKSLETPMKFLENVNELTGVNILSDDCAEKIKNAVCVPLYCTEDEKSIIVPNLQDNCNDVLECINKASDKYDKLSSMLKPIKDRLNKGCDKIVAAIKSNGGATNDALGPKLLLIAITFLATYFY